MIKPLQILNALASTRLVSVLFVLTQTIYLLMLFYAIPSVEAYAPGLRLFDLSPTGYSYQAAIELLQQLGEQGRKRYIQPQLVLDTLYPVFFAVSYALLLCWILQRIATPSSRLFYLSLLPLAGGLFDYIENFFILSMLQSFPEVSSLTVRLASFFTILKSLFSSLFFIALIICLIALAYQKIRTRTND